MWKRRWSDLMGGAVPLLLHLIIVASVFDIYFKSPLVSVPEPHSPEFPAPARRAVLFVADGLRAQSFYQPGAAPFLHQTGSRYGFLGLSHTRVPTESRPGHVALLAGFYEDPSAITKGWSENPVEFDSVLNRSAHSWAWGSPDILTMFAKGSASSNVDIFTYDAAEENFASDDPSNLDTWVFNKVEAFFEAARDDVSLQLQLRQQGIVFFLHLLGCDTNGHTNKPISQQYRDNIRLVDQGVDRIVQAINRYYRDDGRTAFLFSSDHGMTDWGSHGTGMPEETVTPLVAWGAGLGHHALDLDHVSFETLMKMKEVNVNQADIAPLLSILTGRNIPVHSVGVLPDQLLSLHPSHLVQALEIQQKQLLAQYSALHSRHQSVYLPLLFHRQFLGLSASDLEASEHSLRGYLGNSAYDIALSTLRDLIARQQAGIAYYQRYQRFYLLWLMSATFLGSLATNLATLLRGITRPGARGKSQLPLPSRQLEGILAAGLAVAWFCQRLPFHFLLYYLAPVWTLYGLRTELGHLGPMKTVTPSHSWLPLAALAFLLCETVVAAFFDRRALCLGLVLIGATFLIEGEAKAWLILLMTSVAATFPFLAPVDGRSEWLEAVLLASLLLSVYSLFHSIHSNRIIWGLANLLAGLCVYYSGNSSGLSPIVQVVSWCILVGCIPAAILTGPATAASRRTGLVYALTAAYNLLSLSYEALVLALLAAFLAYWTALEERRAKSTPVLDGETGTCGDCDGQEANRWREEDVVSVLRFFFLVFFSFFATGNIASLNSFDPSSIRCFVAVFSPFLMGSLLMLKILIPFLLTAIYFSHIMKLKRLDQTFVISMLQLLSDFLGLHFFHLVRDTGSWLEIGSSLSHFIIVEGTTVFVLILLRMATWLNSVRLGASAADHHFDLYDKRQ